MKQSRFTHVFDDGDTSGQFVFISLTGHHANQRAANIQADKQKGNPGKIFKRRGLSVSYHYPTILSPYI